MGKRKKQQQTGPKRTDQGDGGSNRRDSRQCGSSIRVVSSMDLPFRHSTGMSRAGDDPGPFHWRPASPRSHVCRVPHLPVLPRCAPHLDDASLAVRVLATHLTCHAPIHTRSSNNSRIRIIVRKHENDNTETEKREAHIASSRVRACVVLVCCPPVKPTMLVHTRSSASASFA